MLSKIIYAGAALLLTIAFIFGCGNRQERRTIPAADNEGQLIEADCAFAAMALDSGVAVAFLHYVADSTVLLREGKTPTVGREAIRAAYADAKGFLQWEPQFADISGDLGYTWGHFQFNPGDTTIDGHRQGTGPTSRGYYVTIWKKINGDWKYVLDTGVMGPKEGEE